MAASVAERILQYLEKNEQADSLRLVDILQEKSQKVVGAIKSLDSLGDVITVEQFSNKQWELTSEGKQVAEHGSHEAVVFNAVPENGIHQPELMKQVPNAKVGFSKAMSTGWLVLDKSSGQPIIRRKVKEIQDTVQQNLVEIEAGRVSNVSDDLKQEYKKRKLVQEITVTGFKLKKGPGFSLQVSKPVTDLTPEMISQGTWRNKEFKDYNLGALGVPPVCGHLHPLLKVRAEFRQIFLEMGFTEMPTNNYVESSFWNFDALFQPQQHPARDAQDTFFLSDPKTSSTFPKEYLERVRKVHSEGGYGSQGYGYDWKIEDAEKNVLRTHTTAVSARLLYALAQEGFKPVKYFSIDKVFRNETLDATHLAEFHQVEGVVADYDITLGDLIGVIHEFFKKLGIEKLYFKPAYNPYTEPSMEIFSYHEGLKKWMEVGNSGIFRPEMLLPMGIPENVNVLGWGLSLERPTMIKYGISNIRDLVGPKVDLQMVQDCPIYRLDKEATADNEDQRVLVLETQWEALIDRLEALKQQVRSIKIQYGVPENSSNEEHLDVTIIANPDHIPLAVLAMFKLLQEYMQISILPHIHSTVRVPPKNLMDFLNKISDKTSENQIRFIWKPIDTRVELITSPVSHIKLIGEVNAVRYLSRFLSSKHKEFEWFENISPQHSAQVDYWLDAAHTFSSSKDAHTLINNLEKHLIGRQFLAGKNVSACDMCMFSAITNFKISTLPKNVSNWYKKCQTNKWISLV